MNNVILWILFKNKFKRFATFNLEEAKFNLLYPIPLLDGHRVIGLLVNKVTDMEYPTFTALSIFLLFVLFLMYFLIKLIKKIHNKRLDKRSSNIHNKKTR